MTLHELTKDYNAGLVTEEEYREALRAAGCCDWLANALAYYGQEDRYEDMRHDKDTVYA